MQERREFSRVEDDAIRFRWPGSRRDEPVANLSRSGAKLFTTRSAPVGSLVELELLREGAEPLSLLATVRRVERPTRSDREASLGMSVEFRDLDGEQETVLVRWTGDHSEPAAAKDHAAVEVQQVAASSADYRGKLWEDEESSLTDPDALPQAVVASESEAALELEGGLESAGSPEAEGAASAGEPAPVEPLPVGLREPFDPDAETGEANGMESVRVRELEARLTRAESLAAEALVQLARAERRVEQLEAQDAGSPPPSADAVRPYAGGEDGTSVLEDPLVAELFSRPVDEPDEPVFNEDPSSIPSSSDDAAQTPAQAIESEPADDESPAIEMIERVGASDRRGSPISETEVAQGAESTETASETTEKNASTTESRDVEAVEADAPLPISSESTPDAEVDAPDAAQGEPAVAEEPSEANGQQVASSGGPISGAVAAFHRLAEDPLQTVGFSRSELLGDLAEARPPASAFGSGSAAPDSGESGADASTGQSMDLRVSDEDVFVEVIGLEEDDQASEAGPDSDSGADIDSTEAASDTEPVEIAELVDPEKTRASADEVSASEDSAGGSWPDLELEEPIEDESLSETAESVEELDRPEVPQPADRPPSAGDETRALDLSEPGGATEPNEAEDEATLGSEAHLDVASASDASAFEEAGEADVAGAFDAPSSPDAGEQPSATSGPGGVESPSEEQAPPQDASKLEDGVDEEIESVISSSMVEEIAPPGGSESPSLDSASAPSAADQAEAPSQGSEESAEEEVDDSQHLTLADLPTSSEMVEALGSGRIVCTPRFNRLEPVSRLDIEISDLLRNSDRLDDLEAKTRGRISPSALHRVLFVFFERGLIAVVPED